MRFQALSSSFLAFAAASARANEITHTATFAHVPVGGTSSADVPRFDGSLGVLRSVEVRLVTYVGGTLGLENTCDAPVTLGGANGSVFAIAVVPWRVGDYARQPANPSYPPPMTTLAAWDGLTDFAGDSGATFAFQDEQGDGGPIQQTAFLQDVHLAQFAGVGDVATSIGPIHQQGPAPYMLPPGVVATSDLFCDALLTVRYGYEPFPATFCRPLVGGSACPCANHTWIGLGCGNSVNPNGGTLAVSGVASLSNDTLVLHGTGMTESTALYVQGASFSHLPALHGDGLLCLSGSLVRLGARANVVGASTLPSDGSPSLGVAGGVVAPGMRPYQVIYRDAAPFCEPAVFNTTNGVAVMWSL